MPMAVKCPFKANIEGHWRAGPPPQLILSIRKCLPWSLLSIPQSAQSSSIADCSNVCVCMTIGFCIENSLRGWGGNMELDNISIEMTASGFAVRFQEIRMRIRECPGSSKGCLCPLQSQIKVLRICLCLPNKVARICRGTLIYGRR